MITLDLGGYVITHADDVCWTVSKKCCTASRAKKSGETYLRPVSYHGGLVHALQSAIQLLADDAGAETLAEHVERVENVWADVKRTVLAKQVKNNKEDQK